MNSVRAELSVSGFVQMVGYRYFCYQKAKRLGLSGWVRNDITGSVSAVVEGDRSAIEELIAALKTGPPAARVSDVAVRWNKFTGEFQDFSIRR